MFNFNDLLSKYSQPIKLFIKTDGKYDEQTGVWDPGETEEVNLEAPVFPLSNNDLQTGEGGRFTSEDRKTYLTQEVVQGQVIEVDGQAFTVAGVKDYSYYANGLRVCILQKVGQADE